MPAHDVSEVDCLHRVDSIKTLIKEETSKIHGRLDDINAHVAGQAVDIAVIKTKVDERTSKAPHAISGGIACVAAVVIVWLKGKLGLE